MYLPWRTSSTPEMPSADKRVLDGLALRVEDAVLERDADAGFHAVLSEASGE